MEYVTGGSNPGGDAIFMMVGSGAHSAPILVEPRNREPSRSGEKVIGPARSAPWA